MEKKWSKTDELPGNTAIVWIIGWVIYRLFSKGVVFCQQRAVFGCHDGPRSWSSQAKDPFNAYLVSSWRGVLWDHLQGTFRVEAWTGRTSYPLWISMDSCWMLLIFLGAHQLYPNITKWDWFFGNCSRNLRNFEAWISMDSIEKLAASNPPHFAANYWANTRMIRPEFYHGPGNHQHRGFAQESNGGRNRHTAPGNALCDVDKRWQTEDDTRSFRIFRDSTWLQNGCSMGDPKNNWLQYLHGSMWLKQS